MTQINIPPNFLDVAITLSRSVDYAYGCRVDGDIIEFGTFRGETARIIAHNMRNWHDTLTRKGRLNPTTAKKLYLFDSFKGLPESNAKQDLDNLLVQSGSWAAGTCHGLTAEQLTALVLQTGLPREDFIIYDGWFNATVPTLPAAARFGFIHVDCDLYQSTVDALTPLFARGQVTKGAVVLFDDWNFSAADDAVGERAAWIELVEKFSITFEVMGYYGAYGYRVLVKNYAGMP
jgi:O-methyltransferase